MVTESAWTGTVVRRNSENIVTRARQKKMEWRMLSRKQRPIPSFSFLADMAICGVCGIMALSFSQGMASDRTIHSPYSNFGVSTNFYSPLVSSGRITSLRRLPQDLMTDFLLLWYHLHSHPNQVKTSLRRVGEA